MNKKEIDNILLKQLKHKLLNYEETNDNSLYTSYNYITNDSNKTLINNATIYIDDTKENSYYIVFDEDKKPGNIIQDRISDEEAIRRCFKYKIRYDLDIENMQSYYDRPTKTITNLLTGTIKETKPTPEDILTYCYLPLKPTERYNILLKQKNINKYIKADCIQMFKNLYIKCYSNYTLKEIVKKNVKTYEICYDQTLYTALNIFIYHIEELIENKNINNCYDLLIYQYNELQKVIEEDSLNCNDYKNRAEKLASKHNIDINYFIDKKSTYSWLSKRNDDLTTEEEKQKIYISKLYILVARIYFYLNSNTICMTPQKNETLEDAKKREQKAIEMILNCKNDNGTVQYACYIIAKYLDYSNKLKEHTSHSNELKQLMKDYNEYILMFNGKINSNIIFTTLLTYRNFENTTKKIATKSNPATNLLLLSTPMAHEITKNELVINDYISVIEELKNIEKDINACAFLEADESYTKINELEKRKKILIKELNNKYKNIWSIDLKQYIKPYLQNELQKNSRIYRLVKEYLKKGNENESILYYKMLNHISINDLGDKVTFNDDKNNMLEIPKVNLLDYVSNGDRIARLFILIVQEASNNFKRYDEPIVLSNTTLEKIYTNKNKLRENVKSDLETIKRIFINSTFKVDSNNEKKIYTNIISETEYTKKGAVYVYLKKEFFGIVNFYNRVYYHATNYIDSNYDLKTISLAKYSDEVLTNQQYINNKEYAIVTVAKALENTILPDANMLKQIDNKQIGRKIKEPFEEAINNINEDSTNDLQLSYYDEKTNNSYYKSGLNITTDKLVITHKNSNTKPTSKHRKSKASKYNKSYSKQK